MVQAKAGDMVRVHYTGKLDDGTVFDTSVDRDPLEFTIGEDQVIPGFDQGVGGMNVGESKTVRIPADEAYGLHREELLLSVDRNEMPPQLEPQVGQQLQVRQPDDQTFTVVVVEVSESKVTLDGNHPMAGKALTFDIQLVEIV